MASPHRISLLLTLLTLLSFTSAQFGSGFFDQMFGGNGNGGGRQSQNQNVRSDSGWYMAQYDGAPCDKYLCPGTLSCVHFPHHCPCAWPGVEDKIELGDGTAVCASKGGWKDGEVARKVELARKGVL